MAGEKPYDLYGELPAAWLITLRVDKQGIAVAKVREKREAPSDLPELADWVRLESAPRPGGLGLPCTGISAEWQREDGMWRMEWDYDGAADPQSITFGDPATTTYEIDCSVTSAPIPTHPRFLDLMKKYGGSVNPKNYEWSGFPVKMPGDDTGAKNPLFGAEDFFLTQMVWRHTSASVQLPTDFRKNLGCIDKPRSNNGPQPPQLEGRANWLKTSARATWRGNIYQITEEWTASGPLGWSEDVYRPNG